MTDGKIIGLNICLMIFEVIGFADVLTLECPLLRVPH